MRKLKASSLPTVLVIGVLIMILILMAFEFWNINSFYYIRYHSEKQQKMHLSSALSIFCNDSLLSEQMKIDKKYQLYEEDERSIVYMDVYPWGLYECINMYNFDKSIHTAHIIGKSHDIYRSPAIWVCDRDHPISLSGEAEITGELFLPKNGISYMESNWGSFSGKIIPATKLHTSNKDLPPVDSTYLQLMRDLRNLPVSNSQIPPKYHSFSNDIIYASVADNEDIYAKGKIVLYGDKVRINSSSDISDIILIARHVSIESGFSGALQIMVSDTVEIEKGVYLHYPSGIYIHGDRDKAFLHIDSNSNIEGYAIIEGNVEGGNGFVVDIHYRQEQDSQLTGLLFVDGIAHLEGSVSGATYLKECYYLSGENMYSGLIYNAKIARNKNIAFPFLFQESKFNKKSIKKIE
ncbi:hypothetical protein [Bacteroides ovatus]|uniref:hypothetical protein n=1 Tax=Bacteroides ovatus TaxID=28116 RepID=UPI00203014AD|nr:hypothetical protein [Bacteroides ovatus]MCM1723378.1 hypothetical protein [Bacteroides ovatus]MCM1757665.1 hypothetical protein [Bacteroides ovatus]MCM1869066.1 hypothetical protein [Bacteroides ovatus]MCM1912555.1 hypothetical protein [Bacteroides ovatus]